jgi:hypothetical protein
MKKLIFILSSIFILCMVQNIAYAGNYGSPESSAAPGRLALGIGYSYQASKWEPTRDSFLGIPDFWQDTKVKSEQLYIQGSLGVIKNWEIYFRFGGAGITVKDAFSEFETFRDDFNPFVTGGAKGLLYDAGIWGFGPFAQANYTLSDFEDNISGIVLIDQDLISFNERLKYRGMWSFSTGLAFSLKTLGVSLHGGPFLYWAEADIEDRIDIFINGITESIKDSTTYKEKGNLGVFIGLQVPVGPGLKLAVELESKEETSIGTALTYSF